MQVNITARHLKLTPAIAEYVQKKLEKARRYFDHLIWAQVILDVEKNRHLAEIVIHATGRTFMAKEESADLYAAIDLANDNIDEQLRRYKERRRGHRVDPKVRRRTADWVGAQTLELPEVADHRISSMRALRLTPLSVTEAVSAMEQSDSAHWIFVNKDNQRVTVLYRKPDKTYGVVEAIG
jgi:putative sigma-54 modulation protein